MTRSTPGRPTAMLAGILLLAAVTFSGAPAFAGDVVQTERPADFERAASEAAIIANALQPWTGDFDGMVGRGMVRVAIPYGVTTYFVDGADQKGITYDLVQQFEMQLRERLDAPHLSVVVVPARRDEILPMLIEGRADIAAGTLTVTEERAAIVDFSMPLRSDVREIFVTGPGMQPGATLEDLAALEVHIRRSSSFFEHLTALNAERAAAGLAPFAIVEADENLKTEDLVEMVHAGLIPATVADEPVADFLAQFFPDIALHKDLPLGDGYSFAWAFRKESPQLAAILNDFVGTARKGTMLGNVILNKYLKATDWAVTALGIEQQDRLKHLAELFRRYGEQYAFDWLMVAAQGYQESQLDQSKRSPVGAIGIMQVMPATAADPNVGIPDISAEENNVHAGIKYLRFVHDRYFDDPALSELDRLLFSFAAYNAGPGNVDKARRLAADMGLDPDAWFDNVEIAIGKAVSREPVVYVRNIYKYYVAFRLISELRAQSAQ